MTLTHLKGDSTLAFLAEGYAFGHRRFERVDADAFRTRLKGRPVTMIRGLDAARFFYEGDRFTRVDAMPTSVLHSLQDERSVQTLSGAAHRLRKTSFEHLLLTEKALPLTSTFERRWTQAVRAWPRDEAVDVKREAERALTASALEWAGCSETDTEARTHEITAMIEGAGSFGPRNAHGRLLRRRTERWARDEIRRARANEDGSSPLHAVAHWTDEQGRPLPEAVAGVELLNLIRPVTAVARFIAFAALALHRHPQWRERMRMDPHALEAFCAEVRRTTPFFPVIGGRALFDTSWRGLDIVKGEWVVLDLFATNRHPDEWEHAWEFRPERFLAAPSTAAHIVAQGAGTMATGHRCPGEPATESLLAVGVHGMTSVAWRADDHDVRVDLRRLPALPGRHGMRIRRE
ncbi:cytochrome P450 [Microbacterium sp. LRZ72]|uniref:cytochrome P450 n=1 Tax=Microbacterium sp. LRZ72 TaxID=2942481 RepID=UPI0029B6B356|nr:cytochrome P450 [Microbacterium sp. LRZ72]MDX2376715.1 cytochrome P450 [Microbacterium sp. LRZ72]